MEIAILATCILLLIIANIIQFNRNLNLSDKYLKLNTDFNGLKSDVDSKRKQKEVEELASLIGCRATMPMSLCYADKDHFTVVYELEILDISKDKAKVKVINYTSTDAIANEPSRKNGIIAFVNEKWFSRSSLSIIVDESAKRDMKLRSLGID